MSDNPKTQEEAEEANAAVPGQDGVVAVKGAYTIVRCECGATVSGDDPKQLKKSMAEHRKGSGHK